MSRRMIGSALSIAALSVFSSGAQATLTTFFDLNTATNPTGELNKPVLDQALRDTVGAFKAPLSNVSTYELEGTTPFKATTGAAPDMILGGAATLCGQGRACPANGESSGRFNTTGLLTGTPQTDFGTWIESTSPDKVTSFSMDFTNPIKAFGFFGTDFYDFAGDATFELFNSAGVEVEGGSREVPHMGANLDGSLFFFGLQTTTAFNKIVFTIGQTTDDPDLYDFVGLDSLIIGDLTNGPPNGAPEPGSMALMGAAFVGLWAARRKRKLP